LEKDLFGYSIDLAKSLHHLFLIMAESFSKARNKPNLSKFKNFTLLKTAVFL